MADNTRQLGGSWLAKLWALSPERKYPQEEGRRGLEKLCAALAARPAIHSLESDPRADQWQVWFQIDPAHPLVWGALGHLTFAVNGYEYANEFARFQSIGHIDKLLRSGRRAQLVWTIYPVVRRLDAELYAEYLRDRLAGPTVDPSEWRE